MGFDETLGYCGLYCGGCRVFQATAAGHGLPAEDGTYLRCLGCNSETLTPWCADCELKVCARERGIRNCGLCGEAPCDKLARFLDDPEYPYHRDVPAAMRRLTEVGLAAWSAEQDARWRCQRCGGRFDWFQEECPSCGAPVV